MEYRILGRLEVLRDDQVLSLGGAKQRAVLAVLLVHRREVVSIDRLVDELWGECPPPTASQTVRVYVSRLRKALGDGVLETHGNGYRLVIEPDQFDADRFDALVADGRVALESGDAKHAFDLLTAALELWRGQPLEEFAYEPFAQSEITLLEAARLTALEDRIDAELQFRPPAELVPELEQLVAAHPLRERLVAELMVALYRSGRQADALAAYSATRERLVDRLGLEPGPELSELEQRILQHDPTLMPPRTSIRIGRTRVTWPRVLVAMVVLLAILTPVAFSVAKAHPGPTIAGENGIVSLDAASSQLLSAAPLPAAPGAVSAGGGSVWVAEPGAALVAQIDAASGGGVDKIPVASGPGSIAYGDGAIWVASTDAAMVTRIDPTAEIVTGTVSLPGAHPSALAYGDGGLWVADSVAHELFEIDPATDVVQRTVPLDLQPSALLIEADGIWVAGYANETVEKLDPRSGLVIGRVHVGDGPTALAFGASSLWVANSLDSTVSRIDSTSLVVTATISVGSGPSALADAGGALWVANQYSGTVARINPRRGQVMGSVGVGGEPTSLTVSGPRVWVGLAASTVGHRGGTLVIATPTFLAPSNPAALWPIDPAFFYGEGTDQFMGLVYDSLVNFQQSPGTDGLRLVPDLARSIPTPTDGGRVYAFRLRPGIRYSDGQPLRAGDFLRAFERLFRDSSQAVSSLQNFVGAGACTRDPATCNLAQGIVTNDASGTVTFHLIAPDPTFLYGFTEQAFAAPIPPGTPDHEASGHTVPGTGPYKFASINAHEARFVRNPFFREWSHAAKPDGYPNSIVWRVVPSAQAGVTAIEQGRADWLAGQVPAAQYDQLELKDPALLHSSPEFQVEFFPFNTNLAPFNDVRVRQALNYAIDRAEIVRLYGGPSFATPTCQLIVPGLPGYSPYCPYTQNPKADGAWSGPDVALARRLVEESGTLGERVDLWGATDEGTVPTTVVDYVAGVLSSLGYQVHVHLFSFQKDATPAFWRGIQLSVDGDFSGGYPYPSSYVPLFTTCDGSFSNGYYCNPALDREMQEAGQLEGSDLGKANALWAQIDRQLTDAAVWVPTVTLRDVEITSRRLGNYENSPVGGFLADQAWVK